MGSGKRASMREGPLAALFRKTETEGVEPPASRPEPAREYYPHLHSATSVRAARRLASMHERR